MRHKSLLVLPLVLVAWTAPGSAQSEGDQKALAEIKEVFARLDRAINEHNLAGVMTAYAPGDNIVLLGTGEGERWVGGQEIQTAYAEFFKYFDPGTQETRCTWAMQDIKGNFSWMASMCRVTDFLKNRKREYGINVTAVLEKLDGKWYFRVVHVSTSDSSEECPDEEN
ncbi:MAG: nuclear transport factor 2 family protein [Candidatus Competibacter sp.]|nr:nuclear transport factor 2 family protein [Candidatus Competibacter sp.]